MGRTTREVSRLSLLVLIATGVTAPAIGATDVNSLSVEATGTPGTDVSGADQFAVAGDTPVQISVARLSGGRISVVEGPDADTRAIDFPAYVGSGTYPRAVVALRPSSGNALSPGASDFEYGAVFRLDSNTQGRSVDNGNNVFQRGLYGDSAQFKLQADAGYPACRVKGSSGAAFVRASSPVVRNRWYTVTCSRIGSRLTVEVAPYGGTAASVSKGVTHASGTLSFSSTVRASIGGKLTRSGTLVSSTDQFNGAVARVWVDRVP